jgi:predicted TIM-barrel fold metal-dependent hydrolase
MGMQGVVIEPGLSSNPMHLDDARMYPIYAHCEYLKTPVLFMGGGNAGPDVTYTAPEHIDRVARDFPDLRIISAHGNWPWAAQIIHVCYRRPNIWLSPDMYLFGGMPGAQDYINAANGFMAERFLFATAYPLLPFRDGLEAFLELGIKESVIDRVLYKNAAELLGVYS